MEKTDLESKEDKPNKMLAGDIIKIEEEEDSENGTRFRVLVDLERIFKDPPEKEVTKEFIANDSTEFTAYDPNKEDAISIKVDELREGDEIILFTQMEASNVADKDEMELNKIMLT